MNATVSPQLALNPLASALGGSTTVSGYAQGAPGAQSRSAALGQDAVRAIESMRQNSKKILAMAVSASSAAANAALEAVRAIWAIMMAILRFIARLFGVKETATQKQAETDFAAGAPHSPESLSAAVDAAADAATQNVATATATPSANADAFLRALEYAGVAGADAALLDIVRKPELLATAKAPELMVQAALGKAGQAMSNLEVMFLKASAERADAAASLSGQHTPPVVTNDLVMLYRKTLADDAVGAEQKDQVLRLIQSDDALKAIKGHVEMIQGVMVFVAASALNEDVDLSLIAHAMKRIAGDDWQEKVKSARESLSIRGAEGPAAGEGPANAANATIGATDAYPDVNAIDPAAADRISASFLSGLTLKGQKSQEVENGATNLNSEAPKSPAERLRLAALRAQAFDPFPFESNDDGQDPNLPGVDAPKH